MTKYIVVTGSITEGFRFFGPFDDQIDAFDFGDKSGFNHWDYMKLESAETVT